MNRRSARRWLSVAFVALLGAGILGLAVGGPASAGAPTQTATPPSSGSGVEVTVLQATPVGPLSFM